jgi:hypothetical protein
LARGIRVGKDRVQKLMQQHGINARGKRKFIATTDVTKGPFSLASERLVYRFHEVLTGQEARSKLWKPLDAPRKSEKSRTYAHDSHQATSAQPGAGRPVLAMSAAARLGPQHFAYLRAWVEGVDQAEAARRYLDLAHGHALANLHAQVVDQLRALALARRRGDTRWRLVGIDVGTKGRAPVPADRPPLDVWAAEHGLADFSYDEQLLAYEEAFPVDVGAERRRRRNARLRERQLHVLADLEPVAAVAAKESDPVDAWLSPRLAAQLQRAGYATLGDLARAMRRGDRWYATLKGIGVGKARRVVDQLARLLGPGSTSHAGTPLGSTRLPVASGAATSIARTLRGESGAELDGSRGSNRAERRPTIDAANDRQAIEGWLKAIAARSPSTNASYRKEAERWLLWCLLERRKAL